MRLQTVDLVGVTIDDIDPESVQPLADENGVLRVVDGSPVYPLRGVMVRDADGRAIKASTLRVRTAPSASIPSLTALRCVGCTVTPWVRDGRVALSVLADHVEIAAPTEVRHQAVDHE